MHEGTDAKERPSWKVVIVFLSFAPFELGSTPVSVNPDDRWTEPGVGA